MSLKIINNIQCNLSESSSDLCREAGQAVGAGTPYSNEALDGP
jgi:hypothetical protein